MFNKRKCQKCGNSFGGSVNFCSKCGMKVGDKIEKNYGMLGTDDIEEQFNQIQNSFMGGGLLGGMLNKTMKMLEKELGREMNSQNNQANTRMELFINGQRIDPKKIKVLQKPIQQNSAQEQKQKTIKTLILPFKKEKQDEFSKLPKQEPTTNVRRLSDAVIYELTVPGVKNIDDVSFVQVGESIEVKAIAKDKAYFKSISMNLPIVNYSLSKGKLILEMNTKF